MLSKGSVAILPLVLLLLAWWQRGRISKLDLWQSAPFFAVAIVLTLVNIWFQTHGTESAIRSASFLERLAGAGGAIWFYLFKALVPVELVFVYPQWNIDAANPLWWFPLVTAVAATVLLFVICYRRPSLWARAILFAWLFFCIALLPVLGFVDVGFMKFSLVADHYQYIALIAVVAFVAAVGASWEKSVKRSAQPIFAIAAAVAVILSVGIDPATNQPLRRRHYVGRSYSYSAIHNVGSFTQIWQSTSQPWIATRKPSLMLRKPSA